MFPFTELHDSFDTTMKQDLSPHGMFPIGEEVQIQHTLRSLWFIPGGFGICNVNVVVCYSRSETLIL